MNVRGILKEDAAKDAYPPQNYSYSQRKSMKVKTYVVFTGGMKDLLMTKDTDDRGTGKQ